MTGLLLAVALNGQSETPAWDQRYRSAFSTAAFTLTNRFTCSGDARQQIQRSTTCGDLICATESGIGRLRPVNLSVSLFVFAFVFFQIEAKYITVRFAFFAGTYPPPKACSSFVEHDGRLVLFGGWSHATPYPLHQPARYVISSKLCLSLEHIFLTDVTRKMDASQETMFEALVDCNVSHCFIC